MISLVSKQATYYSFQNFTDLWGHMTSWSLIQCVLTSLGKGAGTRQQTPYPRNVLLQRAVVALLVILSLFTLVFELWNIWVTTEWCSYRIKHNMAILPHSTLESTEKRQKFGSLDTKSGSLNTVSTEVTRYGFLKGKFLSFGYSRNLYFVRPRTSVKNSICAPLFGRKKLRSVTQYQPRVNRVI